MWWPGCPHACAISPSRVGRKVVSGSSTCPSGLGVQMAGVAQSTTGIFKERKEAFYFRRGYPGLQNTREHSGGRTALQDTGVRECLNRSPAPGAAGMPALNLKPSGVGVGEV